MARILLRLLLLVACGLALGILIVDVALRDWRGALTLFGVLWALVFAFHGTYRPRVYVDPPALDRVTRFQSRVMTDDQRRQAAERIVGIRR